jgi:hypothetical protein
MNENELGTGSDVVALLSRHLLYENTGRRKSPRTSVRKGDVPAESQAEHLPNAELYYSEEPG